MLDGRTARKLQTQSAFGAALDSLSDVVVFELSRHSVFHMGITRRWDNGLDSHFILCSRNRTSSRATDLNP